MNANRNLVVDFQINHRHDHYIGKEKHVQPHFIVHKKATKKKRRFG